MPKSVCFYVGLPKTGTTTIQQYLRRQDAGLRSVGFLYPGLREHQALGAHYNHPLMFNAMMGKEKAPSGGLGVEGSRQVVAQAFEKFRESGLENLIWSYEAMALSAHNWDVNYLERILDGADVRIVFFMRYTDDWLESLVKQNVWARASPRARAERLYVRPQRPVAPPSGVRERGAKRRARNTLEVGVEIIEALRLMRKTFPSADIVVRSFDANREKGTVVSGALAAMGVPVEGTFLDADDEAGVKNSTKSDLYSMLLYHLQIAQAGIDVISDVAVAIEKRERRDLTFQPLNGRRFRFLSEDNVIEARGYYERLREDHPDLPIQPPYAPTPAERCLPKDEGVALLDWLRPDISDAIFDRACAVYPANLKG